MSNVYKSLPNLDGEVEDDKKAKADKTEIDANLQRIIGILANTSSRNESSSLDSFQVLITFSIPSIYF